MDTCDYCSRQATEAMTVAGKEQALCKKCADGERRAQRATVLPPGYDQERFEEDCLWLFGPKQSRGTGYEPKPH